MSDRPPLPDGWSIDVRNVSTGLIVALRSHDLVGVDARAKPGTVGYYRCSAIKSWSVLVATSAHPFSELLVSNLSSVIARTPELTDAALWAHEQARQSAITLTNRWANRLATFLQERREVDWVGRVLPDGSPDQHSEAASSSDEDFIQAIQAKRRAVKAKHDRGLEALRAYAEKHGAINLKATPGTPEQPDAGPGGQDPDARP